MKRIDPKLPPHWRENLLRDDRKWLETLADHGYSLKNLDSDSNPIPLLMDIVTSVEYQGHSPGGGGTPIESVKNLAEKFWLYLSETQTLEKLRHQWLNEPKGPWSLRYFLLRRVPYFLRNHQRPHYPLRNSSDSENELLGALEKSVLEAFQKMTEELPLKNHTRLIYQLHMEGLVEVEISALLGVTKLHVKKSIHFAKQKLKGELS